MRRLLALVLGLASALAADTGADLLAAARKGQTARVAALLAKGAPAETTDPNGRTPLMLAAQHGHADIVRLLLERGARPEARDRQGWTAYGLAVFSQSGGREDVLKSLPAASGESRPLRVALAVTWSPDNLYNSCFLTPVQLAQQVSAIQPDVEVAAALRQLALSHGKGVVEFLAGEGDAALRLKVRPGASCFQQTADNLTLSIEAVLQAQDRPALLDKTFGGGVAGWRTRQATSPAQYGAVFGEWAKARAGQIYWAVLEAWLKRH